MSPNTHCRLTILPRIFTRKLLIWDFCLAGSSFKKKKNFFFLRAWVFLENWLDPQWQEKWHHFQLSPRHIICRTKPLHRASTGSHPTGDLCQGELSLQSCTLISHWEVTQSFLPASLCSHWYFHRAILSPDPLRSVQPGSASQLLAMCSHLRLLFDVFKWMLLKGTCWVKDKKLYLLER